MKRLLGLFMILWWGSACLAGCGVLSWLMGTTPETVKDPPIQHVINFLTTLPGIGTMVATGLGVVRWGWIEKAHSDLVKAGKKDANVNGVDDALEVPPAPPTPGAAPSP